MVEVSLRRNLPDFISEPVYQYKSKFNLYGEVVLCKMRKEKEIIYWLRKKGKFPLVEIHVLKNQPMISDVFFSEECQTKNYYLLQFLKFLYHQKSL